MVKCETETVKVPGDLVLSGERVFLVERDGTHHPYGSADRQRMLQRADQLRRSLAA